MVLIQHERLDKKENNVAPVLDSVQREILA
jgi:hypothetical protein